MDWNKLQHTLFALDPADPAEDLRKLKASAGAPSDVAPTKDYVVESAKVAPGSMPVEGNYSIADFAALAGIKPMLTEGPMDAFKAGVQSATSGALAPDSAEKAIKNVLGLNGKEPKINKVSGKPTGDVVAPKNTPTTKEASGLSPKLNAFLAPYATALEAIRINSKGNAEFEAFMKRYDPSIGQPKESQQKTDLPKPRDPNWRDMDALRKSGAGGVHKNKLEVLPRKEKHKGKKEYATESIKEMLYRKLNESK
tara:strand:+ start:69 stop:827 length:759 start_codon:yes stop_codon:yes gene_type:complete